MREPQQPSPRPAADAPPDSLLDLVIEELMRCCDDPTWIEAALNVTAGSRKAFVGRWLGTHPTLVPGNPLAAWAGLSTLADDWRTRTPTLPGSLWEQTLNLNPGTRDNPVNTSEPGNGHERATVTVTGREAYRRWTARYCT